MKKQMKMTEYFQDVETTEDAVPFGFVACPCAFHNFALVVCHCEPPSNFCLPRSVGCGIIERVRERFVCCLHVFVYDLIV
jgi:hypothetical protein